MVEFQCFLSCFPSSFPAFLAFARPPFNCCGLVLELPVDRKGRGQWCLSHFVTWLHPVPKEHLELSVQNLGDR